MSPNIKTQPLRGMFVEWFPAFKAQIQGGRNSLPMEASTFPPVRALLPSPYKGLVRLRRFASVGVCEPLRSVGGVICLRLLKLRLSLEKLLLSLQGFARDL